MKELCPEFIKKVVSNILANSGTLESARDRIAHIVDFALVGWHMTEKFHVEFDSKGIRSMNFVLEYPLENLRMEVDVRIRLVHQVN